MLKEKKTKGFTLIECVIALVIGMIGFTGVFSLLAVCVRTEITSNEMATANALARAKIEDLKNSTRTVGGSLTSNTTNYFDTPNTNYVRRWQITTDSMGTQTVTVALIPTQTVANLSRVNITTRMK